MKSFCFFFSKRSAFFFEKKKQKTFIHLACAVYPALRGAEGPDIVRRKCQ